MLRSITILGFVLLLVSCADGEFLTGAGPAAEWIGEASAPSTATPDTTTTTVPPPPIRATMGVSWWNDPLAVFTDAEAAAVSPEQVVSAVWATGSGTDRYLQAARSDIARALPGLAFPSMLPEEARYISSQLVFSPQTRALAADQVAAFGVWSVEPYTRQRDLAQKAVFLVGWDDVDRVALAGDPSGGCAWFRERDFRSCEQGPADLGPSWWVETFEGRTLIWLDGVYRYELRGRGVSTATVEAIARSMVPISDFDPPGEDTPEG